jgi:hypothetical protein
MLSCVLKAVERVGENLPYGTKLGDRRDAKQVRQLVLPYSPFTFAIFLRSDHRRRGGIWAGGWIKKDKGKLPGIIGG